MIKWLAIASLLLVGCAAPSEYERFPTVELDILDTLTVVFVSPDRELAPTPNLVAAVVYGRPVGLYYWERWIPTVVNRERGVWVMSKTTPVIFECTEDEARDSLVYASILASPIRANEDIRMFPQMVELAYPDFMQQGAKGSGRQ